MQHSLPFALISELAENVDKGKLKGRLSVIMSVLDPISKLSWRCLAEAESFE